MILNQTNEYFKEVIISFSLSLKGAIASVYVPLQKQSEREKKLTLLKIVFELKACFKTMHMLNLTHINRIHNLLHLKSTHKCARFYSLNMRLVFVRIMTDMLKNK